MTKKVMKEAYRNYLRSDYNTIWDKYKEPSRAKELAWEECKKICEEYNGYNLKVICGNTFEFTAGFMTTVSGEGEKLEPGFGRITRYNLDIAPVKDLLE